MLFPGLAFARRAPLTCVLAANGGPGCGMDPWCSVLSAHRGQAGDWDWFWDGGPGAEVLDFAREGFWEYVAGPPWGRELLRAWSSERVRRELAQVRGILADQVAVSVPLDPYLSLRGLASYSGLSVRTLRGHLQDPERPLPYYKVGGRLLVRASEFDNWMAAHRARWEPRLRQTVAATLARLRKNT